MEPAAKAATTAPAVVVETTTTAIRRPATAMPTAPAAVPVLAGTRRRPPATTPAAPATATRTGPSGQKFRSGTGDDDSDTYDSGRNRSKRLRVLGQRYVPTAPEPDPARTARRRANNDNDTTACGSGRRDKADNDTYEP
ncbi:hypothetical protein DL766_007069 [Monosporascus sp. MC13-8B]|uniref:Uncharacterized protein n=1 Tax=Monosporascus cannonballus TaxID=155416 RepID=A0ABY0GSX6_9PEZI|nr:hypothetical protein DL762_009873 [Monosporascus cannonballus]RYO96768.1 hypothetical protein DL763_003044 [Monosporascus cannonballus]RYP25413.1 hypothetical protein DL766_007069 [Monosporascus sp. MC13-8B]